MNTKIDFSHIRKFCYLLIVALFLVTSCQRSQLAASQRNIKNGRVFYTQRYHLETGISPKYVSSKKFIKLPAGQHAARVDFRTDPCITRITPVKTTGSEILIASASSEPVLMVAKPLPGMIHRIIRKNVALVPDTITKNDKPQTAPQNNQPSGNHKKEQLGLLGFLFSIAGLFPVFGLPLAITGLVLSIKSFRKFRQNPGRYNGKGFSIAGIVLGLLGIIVTIVVIGMFISIAIWGENGGAM